LVAELRVVLYLAVDIIVLNALSPIIDLWIVAIIAKLASCARVVDEAILNEAWQAMNALICKVWGKSRLAFLAISRCTVLSAVLDIPDTSFAKESVRVLVVKGSAYFAFGCANLNQARLIIHLTSITRVARDGLIPLAAISAIISLQIIDNTILIGTILRKYA